MTPITTRMTTTPGTSSSSTPTRTSHRMKAIIRCETAGLPGKKKAGVGTRTRGTITAIISRPLPPPPLLLFPLLLQPLSDTAGKFSDRRRRPMAKVPPRPTGASPRRDRGGPRRRRMMPTGRRYLNQFCRPRPPCPPEGPRGRRRHIRTLP